MYNLINLLQTVLSYEYESDDDYHCEDITDNDESYNSDDPQEMSDMGGITLYYAYLYYSGVM